MSVSFRFEKLVCCIHIKQGRQSCHDRQMDIPEVVCCDILWFFFLPTGITTLIAKGVYDSAFPLHDVRWFFVFLKLFVYLTHFTDY